MANQPPHALQLANLEELERQNNPHRRVVDMLLRLGPPTRDQRYFVFLALPLELRDVIDEEFIFRLFFRVINPNRNDFLCYWINNPQHEPTPLTYPSLTRDPFQDCPKLVMLLVDDEMTPLVEWCHANFNSGDHLPYQIANFLPDIHDNDLMYQGLTHINFDISGRLFWWDPYVFQLDYFVGVQWTEMACAPFRVKKLDDDRIVFPPCSNPPSLQCIKWQPVPGIWQTYIPCQPRRCVWSETISEISEDEAESQGEIHFGEQHVDQAVHQGEEEFEEPPRYLADMSIIWM